jgi:hypothetical protein
MLEILATISHQHAQVIGQCLCEYSYENCFITPLLYTDGSDSLEYSQTFGEIPISCLFLTGFLESEIDCWYNITYLQNIQLAYSVMNRSQSLPNIEPPSMFMPSAFKDLTLSDFLYCMPIEIGKHNESNFGRFYDECAPISCTYTARRRRDFVVASMKDFR